MVMCVMSECVRRNNFFWGMYPTHQRMILLFTILMPYLSHNCLSSISPAFSCSYYNSPSFLHLLRTCHWPKYGSIMVPFFLNENLLFCRYFSLNHVSCLVSKVFFLFLKCMWLFIIFYILLNHHFPYCSVVARKCCFIWWSSQDWSACSFPTWECSQFHQG